MAKSNKSKKNLKSDMKFNNRGKNKQNTSRPLDDCSKSGDYFKQGRGDKLNHPEWYAKNEQLLTSSASFSYSWPLGNNLDLNYDHSTLNDTIKATLKNTESIPGLCSLQWVPTIGYSVDKNSPVNIAARNIYSWVRHANSGSANYDAPDLMMYLVAADSLYSLYAMMRRLYGVMRLYTPLNKYYPEALVRAMGFDFNDMQDNLANLNFFINEFAIKVGSTAVPADMAYHRRHIWLNDNIYVDNATSGKAQTYMFVQKAYFKFNNLGTTGTKLTSEVLPDNCTFKQLTEFARSILSPIMGDEDFGIMSGDIIKAYGITNCIKLDEVPTNYTVLPLFDPDTLLQIKNMSLVGNPQFSSSSIPVSKLEVTQDPSINEGILISNPVFGEYVEDTPGNPGNSAPLLKKLITQYVDAPAPIDTMRATRFATIASESIALSGTNLVANVFKTFGSEVATLAEIWTWSKSTSGTWSLSKVQTTMGLDYIEDHGGTPAVNSSIAKIIKSISVMDYFPIVYLCERGQPIDYIFEVNAYTTMVVHDLEKLHETALISEFDVPQVARP